MLKRFVILSLSAIFLLSSCRHRQGIERPKIVIGLVIDQMRWDYLYRYYDLYGNDGFKRLMKGGFNCQNTMIDYLPAFTAPGHTCIYTGSVPALHGIAGNNWIENKTGKPVYCVDDATVHLYGDKSGAMSMSPRNLLTTTITDEYRLATNLKSKVYGVAIKDRGSILPAGHLANAAYWYNDKTGEFTTSSYYPNQHPDWLEAFNKRKGGDSMVKQGWRLLNNSADYDQSTTDANNYEKGFKGEKAPVFPHVFDSLADTDRYAVLKTIPAGNTYTFMMAQACMEGEQLGLTRDAADFMAISLSSTDYAGHQFAPNSVEVEDMYLRLDRDIARFLKFLDRTYGRNNYLLFMTADHGAAHNPEFLQDKDVPSGTLKGSFAEELEDFLIREFKVKKEQKMDLKTNKPIINNESLTRGIVNYQVFLNDSFIVKYKLDRKKVKEMIIDWLKDRPEVSFAIDMESPGKTPVPEPLHHMVVNGYYARRSGVIQFILNPGWFDNSGKTTGTTHGTWNPYDTHIPLIWYGWHVHEGETNAQVHMTDIAPTLAAMLHIHMPKGCVGKPITDVLKKKK